MKFCGECGTPIPEGTDTCPKCHPETVDQPATEKIQSPSPKKKINKMFIIVPIIIVITAIITALVVSLIGSGNNTESVNSVATEQKTERFVNGDCPESDTGNHDYAAPNCVEPAQCYYCDEYRDDKLGNHDWWEPYDDGVKECLYCNMLYEDYVADKE